jgi:hypothetical protein
MQAAGISRQAVEKRRQAGSLFGLKFPGTRDWYYPQWQFAESGSMLDGLSDVLKELPDGDPWGVMLFFLRTDTGAGETPLAALRAGRIEQALRAAQTYGEQGAV